jgi:hypothetical protein
MGELRAIPTVSAVPSPHSIGPQRKLDNAALFGTTSFSDVNAANLRELVGITPGFFWDTSQRYTSGDVPLLAMRLID